MFPHTKLDWTLDRLEKQLRETQDDAAARLELAVACLSRAEFHGGGELWYNRALTEARRVLHSDPTSPGASLVAGMALVGLDRVDHARRHLDEALRLAPERADVHLALGLLHEAESDRHRAVRELEVACRAAPDAWEPHYHLGRLLADRAAELGAPRRLLERAQFHIVRALQLGPTPEVTGPLLHDLGVSCLHMGRLREAQKVFTRLEDHARYADRAHYYLGIAAYELGKYKNAILRLRKYLESHPENARVHARMGMAYLQLGELSKARESCSRALALDPEDLQARWTLGCTLLEEGVLDEATRMFREILRDAPDHLPAFQETVRMRLASGDDRWLRQALRSEVGQYEHLPQKASRQVPGRSRSIEVDPRAITRDRISVILRALDRFDDDQVPAVLEAMDLTTDEGVRFQLWESALDKLAALRARKAARRLKEPAAHFSAAAGREILAVASVLPEAVLMRGLHLDEDDLSRAAVDRHPPAPDVSTHRANVERERQEARAWQSLLLLAIATRHTRSARNLLLRWTVDADAELADAARAALAVWGDPQAAEHLRRRAAARGAEHLVEQLLEAITPPETTVQPRPVSDDEEVTCATCGRRSSEVEHLLVGADAAVCNVCLMHVARHRRELTTDDPAARCALSGRSALESRGVYVYNGVPVSAECIENSLGLLEREEVDRFLAGW